jgi:hypothetical protein
MAGFKMSKSYLDDLIVPRSSNIVPPTGRKMGMKFAGKKKAMEVGIGAATAIVAGGGLGYIEGKFGMPQWFNGWVSLDMLGGIALHAAGLFGLTGHGDYAHIIHDAANGALAYWAGVQGLKMAGVKATVTRDGKAATVMGVGGKRPAMVQGNRNLTPEQIWAMQFANQ